MPKINKEQVLSVVRSGLKWLGGFAAGHGYLKYGALIGSEQFIGLALTLVSMVWSHYSHADEPKPEVKND